MVRLVAILLIVGATVGESAGQEPQANGRSLSDWLAIVKDDSLVRKRRAAVVALGQIVSGNAESGAKIFPALVRAMKTDGSPLVRIQAVGVLGQQTPEAATSFASEFAEALRSERDSAVRQAIAEAVSRFAKLAGASALPLADILTDPQPATRTAALTALARIGKDARTTAPRVVACVDDPNRGVKLSAVFALGRLDPDEPETVAAVLLKVLTADRSAARQAVVGAGLAGGLAVPLRRDAELASTAVVSLGLLGEKSPDVVNGIAGYLADPDAELRQLAAATLGAFGVVGRIAREPLKTALDTDPEPAVRINALRSFVAVAGPTAVEQVPYLVDRLRRDADFEVRIAIIDVLGGFGKDAKSTLPALNEARRDPQLRVREAAQSAIRRIEKAP